MKFPVGESKKKREILGPPHPSAPHPPGPPLKTKLAKFGQQKLAKFGQIRMAKCGQLTLAKVVLAKFGLAKFGQIRMAKTGLAKCGLIRMAKSGLAKCGHGTVLPLDRPSPGPPLPLDRPKFRSFFSLSRRKIRSFLPSLGVFSLNFGGVLKTKTLKCARLEFSGCRVKPRRPHQTGRRGFTRQPENSKRAHLSAPALQTPPKFHGRTP